MVRFYIAPHIDKVNLKALYIPLPLVIGESSWRQSLQCRSSSNGASPMTIHLAGTHFTPGWREAIEIKHLAQGHNTMTPAGFEPAILGSQVQHLNH